MKIKPGYTLLEVLVALTIFAILATITASAMYNAFNTRARVSAQANQLNALQVAMTIIERDIEQIVERAVFANDMQQSPPFVGESKYLEFTRGGSVNPIAVERHSTLKRVAYLCEGKKLVRRGWDNLDILKRKTHADKILLDNLEECSFAYLSNSRQVLPDWRPYAVQQTQRKETVPIAIQLKFTVADWGSMNLLFAIPGALYAPS